MSPLIKCCNLTEMSDSRFPGLVESVTYIGDSHAISAWEEQPAGSLEEDGKAVGSGPIRGMCFKWHDSIIVSVCF